MVLISLLRYCVVDKSIKMRNDTLGTNLCNICPRSAYLPSDFNFFIKCFCKKMTEKSRKIVHNSRRLIWKEDIDATQCFGSNVWNSTLCEFKEFLEQQYKRSSFGIVSIKRPFIVFTYFEESFNGSGLGLPCICPLRILY